MKNTSLIIVSAVMLLSLGGAAYFLFKEPAAGNFSEKIPEDNLTVADDENNQETIYEFSGTLIDVTQGEELYGFAFEGNSGGTIMVNATKESYFLRAVTQNLRDLDEEYFYEGWLVDPREDAKFISTGPLVREGLGVYINDFEGKPELQDYVLYVVTAEPNDGDPLPGEHVLESLLYEGDPLDPEAEEASGIYASYEGNLPAVSDNIKLVLFFTDDKCSSCVAFEEDVIAFLNDIPKGNMIMKVDMNAYSDLSAKYLINKPGVFVQINGDGDELARWEDSDTLQELLSKII